MPHLSPVNFIYVSRTYSVIHPFKQENKNALISVWETSVRATHHFVSAGDIEHYKQQLQQTDFSSFPVLCLFYDAKLTGFIGVADGKIEMLFIDPRFTGRGFGKQLMRFALDELHACKVDVNEQNTNAVRFYESFGFKTYERTEKDAEGKDYPILKMKRPA